MVQKTKSVSKLSLMQRLTDEFLKVESKTMRDPRTKDELLTRHKCHRLEDIIRKRYGKLYYLAISNVDSVIIDEEGKEYDLSQLQGKRVC